MRSGMSNGATASKRAGAKKPPRNRVVILAAGIIAVTIAVNGIAWSVGADDLGLHRVAAALGALALLLLLWLAIRNHLTAQRNAARIDAVCDGLAHATACLPTANGVTATGPVIHAAGRDWVTVTDADLAVFERLEQLEGRSNDANAPIDILPLHEGRSMP